MLPTGPEYFHAYFGILLAGGIPVPIYPPARMSQIEEHVRRHAGILSNAEASILVTVPEARGVARLLEARVPGLRRVVTVAELTERQDTPRPVPIGKDDIAFIQYTSGSTGDPKGVVLTHANLLANIRAMGEAVAVRPDDVLVSWLPLYHDMGLIGMWLDQPLLRDSAGRDVAARLPGATGALAARDPALPRHHLGRAELRVRAVREAHRRRANSTAWICARGAWPANGAEPVLPETMRRFTDRFARYGFRPTAMTPVYGLAECTVGLLCPPLGRGPRIDRVRRQPFSRAGRAEPAGADDANALRFVSCGRPLPGHEVRIVDALGREVGERVEGRLEFRGPSATSGYYRNPEQTARLFDGDWLDTGDRAYVADGEVLSHRPRQGHHHPRRAQHLSARGGGCGRHRCRGCVGAASPCSAAPIPDSGTERLVVLAETRETECGGARMRCARGSSRPPSRCSANRPTRSSLAPPHTVLKTSSGKIRRAACRELYESRARRRARARRAGGR